MASHSEQLIDHWTRQLETRDRVIIAAGRPRIPRLRLGISCALFAIGLTLLITRPHGYVMVAGTFLLIVSVMELVSIFRPRGQGHLTVSSRGLTTNKIPEVRWNWISDIGYRARRGAGGIRLKLDHRGAHAFGSMNGGVLGAMAKLESNAVGSSLIIPDMFPDTRAVIEFLRQQQRRSQRSTE